MVYIIVTSRQVFARHLIFLLESDNNFTVYLQEYSWESCVESFLELYFLSEKVKKRESKYTDFHSSLFASFVKCSETM